MITALDELDQRALKALIVKAEATRADSNASTLSASVSSAVLPFLYSFRGAVDDFEAPGSEEMNDELIASQLSGPISGISPTQVGDSPVTFDDTFHIPTDVTGDD